MPSKLTEKAFANAEPEIGNTGVIGSNHISDIDNSASTNWPPGLQVVISAVGRIEDRVQNGGTTVGPIAELMRTLKKNVDFARSEVLEAHETEMEEHMVTGCGIKWNTDFDGHWESLLEIVQRIESAVQMNHTRKGILRHICVGDDARAMEVCEQNLGKWKGEFQSEVRRILMRKMLDNIKIRRTKSRHTGIANNADHTATSLSTFSSGHTFTNSFRHATLSKPKIMSAGRDQSNYNIDQCQKVIENRTIINIYPRPKRARKPQLHVQKSPLAATAETEDGWETETEQ